MKHFAKVLSALLACAFVLCALCACSPTADDQPEQTTAAPTAAPATTAPATDAPTLASYKALRMCKLRGFSYIQVQSDHNAYIYYETSPNSFVGSRIATGVSRIIFKMADNLEFYEGKYVNPTSDVEIMVFVFEANHKMSGEEADYLWENGINYMFEKSY